MMSNTGGKIVLTVLTAIMVTACVITSFATPITAPQGTGTRHNISEIVAPESLWEKVVIFDGGGFIEGLNFDRDGQLWMVNVLTGQILRLEGDKAVPVGDKYQMPNGAKFHKDGRLFVADSQGELYTFNPSTGERVFLLNKYNYEHFRGLNDLIFDDDGGLYFTDPPGSHVTNAIGRVYYLPPGKDAKLQVFQNNIAFPNGVALSADGKRVYIAEFDTKRIIAAPSVKATGNSPEAPFVFCQLDSGGNGPDGLAVDTEGNLYVACFLAGEITVIDPNGVKYGIIRLPDSAGRIVTSIAFHDKYLYVSESSKNEIWRIQIKKEGLKLFGLQ
jgi:sugar lactone lactonase YvrE